MIVNQAWQKSPPDNERQALLNRAYDSREI